MDVDYGKEFFKETLLCAASLEKSETRKGFEDSRAYGYFINMTGEIGDAFVKMHLADAKDVERWRESALRAAEAYGCLPEPELDSGYFKTMGDVLLLCKKAGIFPYYTAYAAGAALHCALTGKRSPAAARIAADGLQKTMEEMMDLKFEAEIMYLVLRAYQNRLDGISEDDKRVRLMKSAYENGFISESLYGGCSQCVVKALLTVMDKNDKEADFLFKIASPLAGGIAGCNDGACGAYIGANMIAGSMMGRELAELEEEKSESYEQCNRVGQRLHEAFVKIYGTVLCCNVHTRIFGRQFDFRDEKDFEEFEKAGAHEDKCTSVVGITAALAAEALYDEGLL